MLRFGLLLKSLQIVSFFLIFILMSPYVLCSLHIKRHQGEIFNFDGSMPSLWMCVSRSMHFSGFPHLQLHLVLKESYVFFFTLSPSFALSCSRQCCVYFALSCVFMWNAFFCCYSILNTTRVEQLNSLHIEPVFLRKK